MNLHMLVGTDLAFILKLEMDAAPKTCDGVRRRAPLPQQAHASAMERRSRVDSARWIATSASRSRTTRAIRRPDEILLYPGGYSETEILVPYGNTMFASKLGQLAGNHFLTVIEGQEQLARARTARVVGRRSGRRVRPDHGVVAGS